MTGRVRKSGIRVLALVAAIFMMAVMYLTSLTVFPTTALLKDATPQVTNVMTGGEVEDEGEEEEQAPP